MFLGIQRYFRDGSGLPLVPTPKLEGHRLFNPCSPCCENTDPDDQPCNDLCLKMNDPSFQEDIAIINGSGKFILTYSGLNELGYECWRGTVQFSKPLCYSKYYHIVAGSPLNIANNVGAEPYYENGQIYPFPIEPRSYNCQQPQTNPLITNEPSFPCIKDGKVVSLRPWTAIGLQNLTPNCNQGANYVNNGTQFYGCLKYEIESHNVTISSVSYEYYRVPLFNGFYEWRYRFLREDFAEGDYRSPFIYSIIHNEYTTTPTISGPGYANYDYPCQPTLTDYGYDGYFWTYSQPIWSYEKYGEAYAATAYQFKLAGGEVVNSLGYSPVYVYDPYEWINNTGYGPVFLGFSEDTQDMENSYSLDAFMFYQTHAGPKPVRYSHHPNLFAIDPNINFSHSIIAESNTSEYSQKTTLLANGFFRSFMPANITGMFRPDFINRSKRISSELSCQITTNSEIINCVLRCIGQKDSQTFTNTPAGCFNLGVTGNCWALYAGQPTKDSVVFFNLCKDGRYAFIYKGIVANGYYYKKIGAAFFSDFSNIAPTNCPDQSSYVRSCLKYNDWSSLNCDGRLSDDLLELIVNPLFFNYTGIGTVHEIYGTCQEPQITNQNILNTNPLVMQFFARNAVKITLPDYTISSNHPYVCGEDLVDDQYVYPKFHSTGDSYSTEYENASVLITEL